MEASETRRPSVKEMRGRVERSPDLAQDQSPERERLRSHHSQLHHQSFGPHPYSYLFVSVCASNLKTNTIQQSVQNLGPVPQL